MNVRLLQIILFVACCIAAVFGCKKKSYPPPNPIQPNHWKSYIHKMTGNRLWHRTKRYYPPVYSNDTTVMLSDTTAEIILRNDSVVSIPFRDFGYIKLSGADSALLGFYLESYEYDVGPGYYVRNRTQTVLYFLLKDSISITDVVGRMYPTTYIYTTP